MPRGDGTGPMGLGPMTGRGAGFCAGFPAPGFLNPYGFGRRWGFGCSRRWAAPYYVAPYPAYPAGYWSTPAQEATFLKRQADALRESLRNIEKRLRELGGAEEQ